MKKTVLYLLILFIGLTALYSQDAVYQKSVLALYKSSENQTEKENEIFFYMSRALEEMGLKVVYWDIDRGIPGESVTRFHRAIISWFRGPAMRDPEAYLDFLERMIAQGKKVLAVDNMGAYQDRDTGDYVRPLRLNTTLTKLGIMYLGDWTQDGSLLELDHVNSSMVEKDGKQDASQSAFFYHFLPTDHELKTWLSIKRKDREYDSSPVIVTNKNGGFALSRYIYRVENGTVKLLLDVPRFLKEALFPEAEEQKIAILVNPGRSGSDKILEYTESAFSRSKINYQIIPSNNFRGMVPHDFRPFTSVVLILDSDSGIDPAVLETYLEEGGRIISLKTGRFNNLAPYLGMKEFRTRTRDNTGFKISAGLLSGESTELNLREYKWTPGVAVPVDNAEILGTSYNGREPLVWKTKIGKGEVLTWNWDLFAIGNLMGFIVDSVLYMQPVGLAATPALSIMYIDDWPLPMYNIVREPMAPLTDTEFYTTVWWPDIQKILAGWEQPFSSFIIFNYNVNREPPYQTGEFFVAEDNAPLKMAREHLEKGIELGFHGYNHLSLTPRSSELNAFVWSGEENMRTSLEMAREEWIRLFGNHNLPRSYVAPHNVISPEGIKVLHEVFPSIKAVCTLHTSSETPEEAYEYGPNPDFPDVYMLPRLTSGFNLTEEIKMGILSGVSGPGLFIHFIHADDVYDPYRSLGNDWNGLKEEFDKLMTFVRSNHPYLRPMNVYDGFRAMQHFDSQAVDFRIDGDTVKVSTNSSGLIFRVRHEGKSVGSVRGGTVLYSYKNIDETVIRTDGTEVEIRLR
ncbi:DUF2194 domain-containing protein [Spirochaeta isovalerica]|uniref:DUF2194 domain-containing protein n=1 Tax=Spirochaeta isovalerica TaxID=150 RepID=A0A841RDZ8_9SPIO|nr:DUF2194 domain-containing protein [Spirochaeta isovalerica]MBB6480592.1 hypothetical protein [Spirochaeta isovalerica]